MTPRMTPEQAKRMSLAEQHDWYRQLTRRRSLLHGTRAGAGPMAGTRSRSTPMLLTSAGGPHGSALRPFGRHIAYGADPGTQMSIAWQVAAPVRDPFVRVGTSPLDLGEPIAAEVRSLPAPLSAIAAADLVAPSGRTAACQYYLHAAVKGLRPGQTYYYLVGHRDWDRASAEPASTFRTAPGERAPFTFTAFGDQGISSAAVSTSALVRAQNPAFHLHAGDISYAESGGRGLITDCYDPAVWDSFFTEIEPAAGHIPWQIAVGNHELEPWYSADGYGGQHARFDFPGAWSGSAPPTYYSFCFGNVGIVSLDANDVSQEIPASLGYSAGRQTSWLASTLAALRADPGIDFVVVFFHHCAYCTCTAHGSEGGVRQHWAPLFDTYHVDLVINGHNHVYERTDPLRAGTVRAAAPTGCTLTPVTDGTTYITAGGGGQSLYSFSAQDSYAGYVRYRPSVASYVHAEGGPASETVGWSRVRYTGYCLLVIDSEPGWRPGATSTLRVRGLADDGSEIDRLDLLTPAPIQRGSFSGHAPENAPR
jgi:hypothetical protein